MHLVKRRQFLASVAATSTLLGCAREQANASAAPDPGAARDEWSRVRAEFELSSDWVHLGLFLLTSHPRRVREAIERHRKALDDNPALYLAEHMYSTPVLKSASEYMGVKPEEIALTDSTTQGLGVLYNGLPLRSGDEVVTSTHDHYATHESLRFAALRSGATVRKVPLYDAPSSATVKGMTDAIAKALQPATRAVALTFVHSGTGVKTPVRAIADVLAAANARRTADKRILLCVDGVHGLGVEDVTMPDLGCDFFAAGTHKWMFGPRGTGVLWGRTELWPTMQPTIPDFGFTSYHAWLADAAPPPITAERMSPGGFHSFEHRWALGEAFEFHKSIGKAKIGARIHELNRAAKQGLAAMKHVKLHTPIADEVSAGMTIFEVSGIPPKEVVKRLQAKRIIATTTPYVVSYARLAPGVLNSPADVEAALREIRAMG
jgi:selenocysteine lyase/cysteine desulfurase